MATKYRATKYAEEYKTTRWLVPDSTKPIVEGAPIPRKWVAIGQTITLKGKLNKPDRVIPKASADDLKWLVEILGVTMYPYIEIDTTSEKVVDKSTKNK